MNQENKNLRGPEYYANNVNVMKKLMKDTFAY